MYKYKYHNIKRKHELSKSVGILTVTLDFYQKLQRIIIDYAVTQLNSFWENSYSVKTTGLNFDAI